jgi:hypothetical protein
MGTEMEGAVNLPVDWPVSKKKGGLLAQNVALLLEFKHAGHLGSLVVLVNPPFPNPSSVHLDPNSIRG